MLEVKLTQEAVRIQNENEQYFKEKGITFVPTRMTEKACGFDIRYCGEEQITLLPTEEVKLPTGFHAKITSEDTYEDMHFGALLLPRSSIDGLVMTNTVGLCDLNEYEGQFFIKLLNRSNTLKIIQPFERIAQMIIVPCHIPEIQLVSEFSTHSARSSEGFGSTGKI